MLLFVTILQLIAALLLILIVLFQSGKSQGLSGAIGGIAEMKISISSEDDAIAIVVNVCIADSYMAKSKARSLDAKLAKATKWLGAVFVVLTLVLNCMIAAGK